MTRRLRILLLGGSGFLSGTLARLAATGGHEVTVVTRGRRPVPSGVATVVADRGDRAAFAASIAGIMQMGRSHRGDLAAPFGGALGSKYSPSIPSLGPHRNSLAISPRCSAAHLHDPGLAATPGTWDLVVDGIAYTPEDALQDVEVFAGRAARLVFVSTDFVYHPARRKNPQSEDAAADAYANTGYGGDKRRAELALMEHARSDLPWTILRPGHIYGPGSLPGCLPLHGRDPELIAHLRAGRALKLVAGGRFLQQPVFAPDLARVILDVAGRPETANRVFNVAGPDVIPSRVYYEVLGDLLGCVVQIEDVPVEEFLAAFPDKAPFCCERVYDLSALRAAGVALPATPLAEGLRQMLADLKLGNAFKG